MLETRHSCRNRIALRRDINVSDVLMVTPEMTSELIGCVYEPTKRLTPINNDHPTINVSIVIVIYRMFSQDTFFVEEKSGEPIF